MTSELADAARSEGRLALDTEFMTEGRYWPLLCLVQVAVPDGERSRVQVLDPLEGFDPAPLAAVLADPAVEVIVHAGRQDVAMLRREWRTEVRGVFDTQVAAAFTGLGAQTGYSKLLGQVLGVEVHGSAGFTRWDRRPLTDEQLKYAREDVDELPALAAELQRRLHAQGRLEWARQECLPLEEASDEREPDEAWRRLPRVNRLKPPARAVARELAAWRERTAAEENRTVASVVSDSALVELARSQPSSQTELEAIRGLHGRTARRRGEQLLAAIERGRRGEPPSLPPRADAPPVEDAPVVSLCEALVRSRALEAKLAYELLATRADLVKLVAAVRSGAAEPDVRMLQGWRRELVGEELLDLLAGRSRVSVDAEGILHVEPA